MKENQTTWRLPGGRVIGGPRTFVIAEIGSNHGGDLQRALDTIDAVAESGADAAKFQSLCLDQQWYRPTPEVIALHRTIDLDEDWVPALKARCDQQGLVFFSSPTYLRAVDVLESIGVGLYKLASAQVGTFPQIVDHVGKTMKPVILSTGLVTLEELDAIIARLKRIGNDRIAILHCNSLYPTPVDKVHLPRMIEYRTRYQCPVGFSDHTEGITVSLAAVAMGATIIEKHFCLDQDLVTPDTPFSLDPIQFSEMVQQIRQVEWAVRPGRRDRLEREEASFRQSILQRLVLKRPKSKGESFTSDDFDYRRNSQGIDCRQEDEVVDYWAAGRDLDSGELIEWNDLEKRK